MMRIEAIFPSLFAAAILAFLPGAPPRAEPAPAATAQAATEAKADAKPADPAASAEKKPDPELETFLDRLMMAESSGRDFLRNPLSTAVGPFQFIEATFLEVVRRNFAAETAQLGPPQILALRTNRAFARKVAEAFTVENAGHLSRAGVTPSFAHLRLAYFVGPAAAVRVIKMPPQTPVALVLGPAAIKANPFLVRYTAADLIARAAREVSVDPAAVAGVAPRPGSAAKKPARLIQPACNLTQASCRRWLALAERRLAKGQKVVSRAR